MKTHLSDEAMLRWHTGEADETERRHIAECADCRERLAPMTNALRLFGASARQWGTERAAAPRRAQAAVHRWSRVTVAAAFACLLLLATGLIALRSPAPHRTPDVIRTAQQRDTMQPATSDDALLEAVDQDVSREVPEAMQPLSWSTTTGTTTARQ